MGRTRGGLTTKIHALVEGSGLPIQLPCPKVRPAIAGRLKDCWLLCRGGPLSWPTKLMTAMPFAAGSPLREALRTSQLSVTAVKASRSAAFSTAIEIC
jgi:hypothetical protein